MQELDNAGKITLVSRAVQEIVAFDVTKKAYTARITTTDAAGDTTVDRQTISAEELAAADEMLRTCETRGGKRRQVRVGAESVATCRVTAADPESERPITIWFAAVPFGLARSEMGMEQKQMISTRLESYHYGTSLASF